MQPTNIQTNNEGMLKKEESKSHDKEEEDKMVGLFHEVVEKPNGNEQKYKDAEEEIIKLFKTKLSTACRRELYSDKVKLNVFFYRYSPLYAGTTRNRFLTALRDCEELKSCFNRPSLKLIDIGSGAGSAMIGLYSALYEENIELQNLEVTAVDYNDCWEKFNMDIVKKIKEDQEDKFGFASKFFKKRNIKHCYICFDVVNVDAAKVKNIRETDVVLMKGFLSILDDYECRKVIKNISSVMKPGSFLIIIESPTYEHFFQTKSLRLIFTTRKFLKSLEPSGEKVRDSSSASQQQQRHASFLTQVPDVTTQSPSFISEDGSSTSQIIKSEFKNEDLDQVLHSVSHRTWEDFDAHKESDREDYFRLRGCLAETFDIGLSFKSNQQIFILVKE